MLHLTSKYLFVSYAREDIELLKEIRSFADCLSDFEWWDDSKLSPGDDWDSSIFQAIDHSCAALLLVSQHSLRSDFIWDHEVPRLLQKNIPLSWLKIRECPWDLSSRASVIKSLQALRDPSVSFSAMSAPHRETELNKIIRKISEFSGSARSLQISKEHIEQLPAVEKMISIPQYDSNVSSKLSVQLDFGSESRRIASLAIFNAIHDLATEGRFVTLAEINAHYSVIHAGLSQKDPTSLRKTLIQLLRAGLLPGVLLKPKGLLLEEEHFALKTQKEVCEKRVVASAALQQISDGSLILLDAGSTTLAIAELLGNALVSQMLCNITVVTHSPAHAVKLLEVACAEGWTEKDSPLKVVIAGGILRPETEACVEESGFSGPLLAFESAVSNHTGPSFGFVGANGITPEQGFTTADPREAKIKDYILRSVDHPYVVADGMKLGKRWNSTFGNIDRDTVITTLPHPSRNSEAGKVIEYLQAFNRHVILRGDETSL